ncbi:hypothetical protein IMZ48_26885 [Candidatus Bathyarchaeota archaeon]|nr:hypothetical protein [Candidatus Bathyarchaeota archaeon]
MKKVGNTASNKIYNPKAKKPPIPIDADEADSAMGRFIRAKYVTNGLNGGAKKPNMGASLSDNDTPPPPPPKTGKFGLRSASSMFPLSSKAKRQAPAEDGLSAPRESTRSPSPGLTNKVFGARLGYDDGELEKKLIRLRDMGFTDHSRNIAILKGVNGNVEQAIDTLVRLGGSDSKSTSLIAPRDSSLRATRSLTPLSTPLSTRSPTNGSEAPFTPSTSSTNPFDMLTPQPQTAQSTGTLQNKNPYLPSTNPFGAPGSSHSDGFPQAFQNMSLAPPQPQPQPLFPNHTGGIHTQPTQQGYLQSSVPTPPVPPMPFNTYETYPQPQMMPQQQPQQVQNGYSSLSPQSTQSTPGLGHNPFFANQNQQQPLTVNTTASPQSYANNPFTRSPTRIQSPALGQIPEQSQYVTASPAAHPTNPWYTPPQQPQHTSQRPNNASIMAMYNYPHLAPNLAPQQQPQPQPQPQLQPVQEQQPFAGAVPYQPTGSQQQPRSASTPLSGTKNPFFVPNGATSPPSHSTDPFGNGIVKPNRDSIALGLDMASWSNGGRHSPDAFASLSARHG